MIAAKSSTLLNYNSQYPKKQYIHGITGLALSFSQGAKPAVPESSLA